MWVASQAKERELAGGDYPWTDTSALISHYLHSGDHDSFQTQAVTRTFQLRTFQLRISRDNIESSCIPPVLNLSVQVSDRQEEQGGHTI